MTLKENILKKIKSISDLKLLRELDAWIRMAEEKSHEEVNEPDETYQTEESIKDQGKKSESGYALKSPIDYLGKIAKKGGVAGIDDPVEWQKKERRDRTITHS